MATSIAAFTFTHTDGYKNDGDEVMTNLNSIRTTFNNAFDNSTGHYHDGTDSRLVFGGFTGFNAEEAMLAIVSGVFGGGSI